MPSKQTDFLGNLRRLYRSYGGISALLSSGYFYSSAIVAGCCWRVISTGEWSDIARSVLPNLIGFSIAAYALLFAVLDESQRRALRRPSDRLGGRSPLLVLASSITHAILVQMLAIVIAIIFWSKPFSDVARFHAFGICMNLVASGIGMFLTAYGIILVSAAALSLFRLMELAPSEPGKKADADETQTPSTP